MGFLLQCFDKKEAWGIQYRNMNFPSYFILMMIETWNLPSLMAEMMINTMVLILLFCGDI